MRLIDADALQEAMYHEAFETDSDMQKWDSGCWIRYKMFENNLDSAPTVDVEPVNHWIPCSERLPKDEGKVLCCTITTKGIKNIVIGYYVERWCCGMNSNVIAWMPLPEMYKENK